MNDSTLFSMLLTQTWQVAIVAIAVWVAVRTVASNRPHLAHALWLLVLLKALTPPVVASPTSPFCWVGAGGNVIASNSFSSAAPAEDGATSFSVRYNSESLASQPAATGTDTNQTPGKSSPVILAQYWQQWLLSVWIIGSVFATACLLLRYALFLRWISRSNETRIPQIESLLARLAKQIGTKRHVRIRVLDIPVGPAVLGFLRPTIVLPASIVHGRTDDQIAPLLAHELVHLRRGDLWWAMVQSLARCLFWFHPLVHLAERRLTWEAERSCDEETIASLGCSPANYARCLLNVLEQKHQLRVAPALPGVRPVEITLARLERVMKLGNGCHRKSPAWVWLVLLLGCAVLLPGAAFVLAQEPVESVAEVQTPAAEVEEKNAELVHALEMKIVSINEQTWEQDGIEWKEQESFDFPADGDSTNSKAGKHVTTRTNDLPTKTAVMNQKQVRELTKSLEANPDCEVLSSPNLASCNGRPAELLAGTEHPFIVNFEKAGTSVKDGKEEVVWQPIIDFVRAGLKVTLVPAIQENGDLQIAVQFAQLKLDSAEWIEFPDDASQKVQRPIVTDNRGSAKADVPEEGALVVLIPGAMDGKTALCVINRRKTDSIVPPDASEQTVVTVPNCVEVFSFPGAKEEVRHFLIQQAFAVEMHDAPQESNDAGESPVDDNSKPLVEAPGSHAAKQSHSKPVSISVKKGTRCSIQFPAAFSKAIVNDPAMVRVNPVSDCRVEIDLLESGTTRVGFQQACGQIIDVDLSISVEDPEGEPLPSIK